jgi:hypothetical protein
VIDTKAAANAKAGAANRKANAVVEEEAAPASHIQRAGANVMVDTKTRTKTKTIEINAEATAPDVTRTKIKINTEAARITDAVTAQEARNVAAAPSAAVPVAAIMVHADGASHLRATVDLAADRVEAIGVRAVGVTAHIVATLQIVCLSLQYLWATYLARCHSLLSFLIHAHSSHACKLICN